MARAFGIMSTNSPPSPGSQDFSVIFKAVFDFCIGLYFYKYMVYFELVFVLDSRFRLTFIIFACRVLADHDQVLKCKSETLHCSSISLKLYFYSVLVSRTFF